ncbi:MAG TPA: large terminase, partial [Coriobacteriia bacterium]|nr:large terminase [Coriobacteriia bacterium]
MLLVVPGPDSEPWPTLGPQVCALIEERVVYGPGSLQGQPYVIDPEFRAFIYRASEVFPKGHPWAGRRRFKRVGMSVRKGLAKTEKMAVFAFVELHPEGPTRCDGFDAHGNPVGRPVRSPYIPMLAVTVEQVEELAFGALKYIIEEGPDADLFDVSLERIIRLDEWGRADGRAVPLSNSPGARDGARTTLNCFDEPHRLYLPRQLQAHTTMDANLPKRPLDDPWSLYVGTAGELGQKSVAEQLHTEAEMI